MTLTKDDLLKAKEAWTKIKKQSEIDADQSDMYIETIDKKLEMIKDDSNT